MEKVFFDLIEDNACLHVEVGYNSIADWCLEVKDRKGGSFSTAKKVVSIQECDRNRLFSRAYLELTTYLSEARGGY